MVGERERASFSDHTQPCGKKLRCQHRLAAVLRQTFYQTNPSYLNKSLGRGELKEKEKFRKGNSEKR